MSSKIALPACAHRPPVTKDGFCWLRVSLLLPFPSLLLRFLHFPLLSRPVHTRRANDSPAGCPCRPLCRCTDCTDTFTGASGPRVFSTDPRFCRVKLQCLSRARCRLCSGFAPVFWAHSLASVTWGRLLQSWSHGGWKTSKQQGERQSQGAIWALWSTTLTFTSLCLYKSSELIPSVQRLPKCLLCWNKSSSCRQTRPCML